MKQKQRTFSFRTFLISLILIPLNSYWMVQLELVWGGTYPSVITLLFTAVFSLFTLTLLNGLIRQFLPEKALSQGELIVIYVMTAVGSSLSGCDVMQTLVHLIGSPFYFATPENEWKELFHRHLPNWLVVSDEKVLRGFFEGKSSFWIAENLVVWFPRIFVWTAFAFILYFTTLCLNVIFRKQWIEREKLTYPIVRLPYEVTKTDDSILSKKVLWIGFSAAALINIVNGFSFIFPQIPSIPIKARWIRFAEKPWNAIGWFTVSFYPFAMGIGFLMPLDLSFSCWFFFLLWRAERIFGKALGIPYFPAEFEQATGVWIAILVFVLWMERGYLKNIFMKAIGERFNNDSSVEPVSYRTAFLGVILGFSLILLFFLKAGMSLWFSSVYFFIYFALAITITRIRAELGPPVHDLMGVGPDYLMKNIFGTRRLGTQNLTLMSLLYWLNRESYRSFPMAHQLEGFKLAEQGNIKNRGLFYAIMLAILIGALSCFFVVLNFSYELGSSVRFGGPARWFATESYRRLARWLSYPTETDYRALLYTLFGFLFSFSLLIMRTRLFWFPFHPIGYAISYWWAMSLLWFPIFISFVVKSSILRFGGIKLYRKTVPFFLGLILGEYTIGSLWSIIGIVIGKRLYAFWV